MTVYGYLMPRETGEGIENLDVQQRNVQIYAQEIEVVVDQYYTEEKSSLSFPFRKRSVGSALLAEVKSGDVVLVSRADSVLGSAMEGLQLVELFTEKGVSLYCCDLRENITLQTPRKLVVSEGGAPLIKKLLEIIATSEKNSHGDSIRAAKRKMKEDGKYLGGPVPFGWKVTNGYLVRDSEQQKVIREIQKLKKERWSYRDISRKLQEKYDVALSHEGVRKIHLKDRGKEKG